MWLFTPDISFNLEHYKSLWTSGGSDVFLHLVPFFGEGEDTVRFDTPLSAIRAFDAVMNGLGRGCQSVYLQEVYTGGKDSGPSLRVCYDRQDYVTLARNNERGETVICDPRSEPLKIYAPPGQIKS